MGTRWQLHCKNKLCVSRGRREPCRHIGRKWHIRGLLLLGAGEVHAGRWTADGWWEGLVGRWICLWQIDVDRWHQLAGGCPVLG